jgi:hypothetical protein
VSLSKREFEAIAAAIQELDLPCRVKTFNVLVPVMKKANSLFRARDFFDAAFAPQLLEGERKYVMMDQYTLRAILVAQHADEV